MIPLRVFLVSTALSAGCGNSDEGDGTTTDVSGTTSMAETSMSSSSTGSTGGDSTTTDAGSSTGSSTGGSTTGAPDFYVPCEGTDACDDPLICNTLSGFCTIPCSGEDPEPCPDPATGDATPTCSMTTTTCVLSCFDGETCPDGMTCEGNTELAFCQF